MRERRAELACPAPRLTGCRSLFPHAWPTTGIWSASLHSRCAVCRVRPTTVEGLKRLQRRYEGGPASPLVTGPTSLSFLES